MKKTRILVLAIAATFMFTFVTGCSGNIKAIARTERHYKPVATPDILLDGALSINEPEIPGEAPSVEHDDVILPPPYSDNRYSI